MYCLFKKWLPIVSSKLLYKWVTTSWTYGINQVIWTIWSKQQQKRYTMTVSEWVSDYEKDKQVHKGAWLLKTKEYSLFMESKIIVLFFPERPLLYWFFIHVHEIQFMLGKILSFILIKCNIVLIWNRIFHQINKIKIVGILFIF